MRDHVGSLPWSSWVYRVVLQHQQLGIAVVVLCWMDDVRFKRRSCKIVCGHGGAGRLSFFKPRILGKAVAERPVELNINPACQVRPSQKHR